MSYITRRGFLSAITAVAASPVLRYGYEKSDSNFRDIQVGFRYAIMLKDLKGPYISYPEMGYRLVSFLRALRRYGHRVEDSVAAIEEVGTCLRERLDNDLPRDALVIPLTKDWLMEFWRRHRYDTPDDWYARCGMHISGMYPPPPANGYILERKS